MYCTSSLIQMPLDLFMHACLPAPWNKLSRQNTVQGDISIGDIPGIWNPLFFWPCLPSIYPVKFHPKATDMQIRSALSQFVFPWSSWPTSVKPIFPAWNALRVNSPASAGLMPGTLPEKHTQTHKHMHGTQTWRKVWGTRWARIAGHLQTQGHLVAQSSLGMKTGTCAGWRGDTFFVFTSVLVSSGGNHIMSETIQKMGVAICSLGENIWQNILSGTLRGHLSSILLEQLSEATYDVRPFLSNTSFLWSAPIVG